MVMDGGGVQRNWELSTRISIYKGKGGVLECGSYRVIKILEYRMMVLERV